MRFISFLPILRESGLPADNGKLPAALSIILFEWFLTKFEDFTAEKNKEWRPISRVATHPTHSNQLTPLVQTPMLMICFITT